MSMITKKAKSFDHHGIPGIIWFRNLAKHKFTIIKYWGLYYCLYVLMGVVYKEAEIYHRFSA